MFLLDTNTCIYLINQKPGHERILQHMDGQEYGNVVISSISAGELYFGVSASERVEQNQVRLARFLATFDVVPFDETASWHYGNIRAYLKRQGTPIGPLDTLIAGHALALHATVVTNNVGEFRRVSGLDVVDWLS